MKEPPMTNATDALRDFDEALAWVRHRMKTVPAGRFLVQYEDVIRAALATPAGSASGEVQRYFRGEYGMVAAGPEYPHRDGDTYWVAEQDYAALQAEVARAREMNRALADDLCAAESEAARLREDAARLDWLERAGDVYFGIVVDAPHDGEYSLHHDLAGQPAFGPTLRAAIDAAMGSANGQG